ncbi:bifunctional NAD(P)H-hydrate repair enzyme Nnr [Marinobacterium zhoushanense]|uniref:ADP-dependent (S)-NAD(P)H-hydrate dehydratase n=1 Tax=Marinobacterium zhoushanense TaxID=1679163 RepID=A0ABQ1KUH2_9GAMM|nr:bifunctional NAD(P)H-hydrate repair enzyme Nnr [Marinobacterium zhoushanense]
MVAGLAWQAGIEVQLVVVGERFPERLHGEALEAWQWLSGIGVKAQTWHPGIEFSGELLVDALLGIGLSGQVRGEMVSVIAQINRGTVPVLAVDIPSGLCADSGAVLGAAVKADLTLTFIALKQGLLTHEGVDCVGELLFDGLLLSDEVFEEVPVSAFRTDSEDLRELLPPRPGSAHKGHYGHLLIVGGDLGMGGAALMAAQAALRSGAGLVTLATREEHRLAAITRAPEVMCHAVEDAEDLEPLIARADVIVVGPGLGQQLWGCTLLQAVLESGKPLLLDADALNLLAQDAVSVSSCQWVLTPHPGEAARLLETDVADIQANRFEQVRELQNRYGGTVVLKGAGTLSCDGDVIHLCSDGNPGMATAGMGDVLSGVIGALLAQRLAPLDAARIGVLVHARAADLCAQRLGARGLLATDLLNTLPLAINEQEYDD